MPCTIQDIGRSAISLLLVVSVLGAKAQEVTLAGSLEALRANADQAIEELRVIHDPNELSMWNGYSDLSAAQVYSITDEVRRLLVELRGPLEHFAVLAVQRLDAPVLLPIQDDLSIAGRDIETALNSLVLAAEEQEVHMTHARGCRHQNVPMLQALEAVRDIQATLAQVAATLVLFNIPDTQ